MNKFALAGLIVFSSSTVLADTMQEKDFYIYPHLNYYNYDDIDGTSIDNGNRLGLAVGMRFHNNWSAELSLDSVESNAAGTDVVTTLWQLNGLYSFNRDGSWQPFLMAGIGDASNELDSTPKQTEDGTSIDAGAGINYVVNRVFALRGDVRAIHTFDYSATDMMATLGLTLSFGDSSGSGSVAAVTADSDSDGIADNADSCAGTPSGVEVDANGCEIDSDKDGVADSADQCPSTAEGIKVDEKGCAADSDGDGVTDDKDQCSDTPEGALVDENGCLKKLTEAVSYTMSLSFDTGKADIKPEFEEQISKVANFMKQYPETTVVIEGHSDSQGNADFNRKLSEQRAQSVVNELVNNYGIDAARLSAVGYGEDQPVADNSTSEGRKANRRVVAKVTGTVEKQ